MRCAVAQSTIAIGPSHSFCEIELCATINRVCLSWSCRLECHRVVPPVVFCLSSSELHCLCTIDHFASVLPTYLMEDRRVSSLGSIGTDFDSFIFYELAGSSGGSSSTTKTERQTRPQQIQPTQHQIAQERRNRQLWTSAVRATHGSAEHFSPARMQMPPSRRRSSHSAGSSSNPRGKTDRTRYRLGMRDEAAKRLWSAWQDSARQSTAVDTMLAYEASHP